MFEFCRKIVAGPKKKLQWNGKQLDLTYVTDRIIAMAFPASGLQSAYRNSIKDVAQYFSQKHGQHYLIINVSSRKYDYTFFNNNVLDYEWRDHLSPPLSTLFEIARQMYQYLRKNKKNVVAVHCNHGKGRTGTTIIAFLLFTGLFGKFDQALSFYNKRRFVSLTYGVSQPCQKRYLNYFQVLKQKSSLSPKLISYKLKNIQQKGLDGEKYYIEITSIRNEEPKYRQLCLNQGVKRLYPNVPLMGDICIQVFEDKWKGPQEVAMINCNTFFFDAAENWLKVQESMKRQYDQNQKQMMQYSTFTSFSKAITKHLRFSGQNIKVNTKYNSNFDLYIDFQWYCYCHLQGAGKKDCPCQEQRLKEEKYWKRTAENVEVSRNISKLEGCCLLSTMEYIHQEIQSDEHKIQHHHHHVQKKKSLVSKQHLEQHLTSTSPLTSQSQKYSISQSDKSSTNYGFSNSFDGGNKTQDNFGNEEFEYDMVIVNNRNSTNSV